MKSWHNLVWEGPPFSLTLENPGLLHSGALHKLAEDGFHPTIQSAHYYSQHCFPSNINGYWMPAGHLTTDHNSYRTAVQVIFQLVTTAVQVIFQLVATDRAHNSPAL